MRGEGGRGERESEKWADLAAVNAEGNIETEGLLQV